MFYWLNSIEIYFGEVRLGMLNLVVNFNSILSNLWRTIFLISKFTIIQRYKPLVVSVGFGHTEFGWGAGTDGLE